MADLEYNVKIDTAKALKGVKDLRKQLKKSGQAAKKADKSFSLFGASLGKLGGILGALSIGGLGLAVKGSLDFADAIGKAADVADVSTSSLQELRFAFDKFGISSKETDDGLRRLSRRLGEFVKSGAGPAKVAFDQLGLSSDIMSGKIKGTEAVFNKVGELFGRIEDQTVKSALAAQLFGDDAGPKLAAALAKGLGPINKLKQAARELGLVMDEGLIRGAEKANDQLSVLAQVIKTQVITAVISAAPQIQAFATSIIENRAGIQSTINLLVEFAKVLGKVGGAIVDFAKSAGIISMTVDEEITKVKEIMAGGLDERLRFFGKDGWVEYYSDSELKERLANLLQKKRELEAKNAESTAKTKKLAEDAAAALAKIKPFKLIKPPKTEDVAAAKKAIDTQKKLLADLKKDALALADAFDPYATSLKKLEDQQWLVEDAFQAGLISLKQYKDALGGIAIAEKELNATREQESTKWSDGWNRAYKGYIKDSDDAASNAERVFNNATKSMEDSLVNFSKTGKLSFKDLASSIIEDLYRIQIRKTASSIFSGSGGAGGGGIFAGLFAQGGYIPAGKVGIVGERGPELVSGPANVTSAADTAAMMGGGGGTTNINIYANDAQSFNDMLARDPGFVNQVVQAGSRINGRR